MYSACSDKLKCYLITKEQERKRQKISNVKAKYKINTQENDFKLLRFILANFC